jgi:hypothetical protein
MGDVNDTPQVVDDPAASRFMVEADGRVAELVYQLRVTGCCSSTPAFPGRSKDRASAASWWPPPWMRPSAGA